MFKPQSQIPLKPISLKGLIKESHHSINLSFSFQRQFIFIFQKSFVSSLKNYGKIFLLQICYVFLFLYYYRLCFLVWHRNKTRGIWLSDSEISIRVRGNNEYFLYEINTFVINLLIVKYMTKCGKFIFGGWMFYKNDDDNFFIIKKLIVFINFEYSRKLN